MAEVNSTMLPLGTPAPEFALPDADGNTVSLGQFDGASAYVVAFICNHCPYVFHIRRDFARLADEYLERGVAVIAINANDATLYPDDSPEKMKAQIFEAGYTFPYLFDETQEVAKAYRAACTPDFYVFDRDRYLCYRGQFDESRPGNGVSVTGSDLRAALDATLEGERILDDVQKPSIGCGIKWKPGNEPDYVTAKS